MTRGRPSKFTPAIAATICERIAEGQSLREICKADDIPPMRTIFDWLASNDEFSQQYARAREAQADALVEEILEIADDARNDWMDRQQGEDTIRVVDHEHIARSRLRVDSRKWFASKVAPKKYGERVTQELVGKDNGPIQTEEINARDAILSRIAGISSRTGSQGTSGKPH